MFSSNNYEWLDRKTQKAGFYSSSVSYDEEGNQIFNQEETEIIRVRYEYLQRLNRVLSENGNVKYIIKIRK